MHRAKHIMGPLIIACGVAFCMNILKADRAGGQSPQPSLEGMSLSEVVERRLHHGQERFVNPWNPSGPGRILKLLEWKLFSRNDFKGMYGDERVTPVDIDWKPVKESRGLSVTFVTHACVMIRDLDRSILIDPVLDGIPWPIKNFTPISSGISGMPEPDYVLITHGHYDHLDTDSVERFAGRARFISPLGYRGILEEAGVKNLTELDWLGSFSDGSREITLLPCNHWTMRNPFEGRNTALWGSFLIRTKAGQVIYVSGDTAYFDRFAEIGEMADIDLAIFSLGAYEPRWFMKQSHLNPAETVKAFRELGAKKLMVVHWGTFRLGDEPVFLPPLQIREEMEKAGLADRLVDIKHGETFFFGK